MATEINKDEILHGLLEDNDEWIRLYHLDAQFKAEVDMLVLFLGTLVEGLAAKALMDMERRMKLMADERSAHPVHLVEQRHLRDLGRLPPQLDKKI